MQTYTLLCPKCPAEITFSDHGETDRRVVCTNCQTLVYARTPHGVVCASRERCQPHQEPDRTTPADDWIGPPLTLSARERAIAKALLSW